MAALQHACGKELITPPQPVDNRFREFSFCLYFVLSVFYIFSIDVLFVGVFTYVHILL